MKTIDQLWKDVEIGVVRKRDFLNKHQLFEVVAKKVQSMKDIGGVSLETC